MKKTIWLVLAAAFGLSGCANLDNKPAHELMKISRERALAKDYNFNFRGEIKAYVSDKEGLEEATDQNLSHDMFEILLKDRDGLIRSLGDFIEQYPGLSQYIVNGRIKYQGAVDLVQEKIELIPELELNNHNDYSNKKMLILLDGKDKSITIDPPASIPFALALVVSPRVRKRLVDGGLIKFKFDSGNLKGIPLGHTMKAVLLAINKSSEGLSPEAFTLKDIDAYGKKLKARYRVQYIYHTPQDDKVFNSEFIKLFDEEMAKLQKTPESGSTVEGYEKAREYVHSIVSGTEQPEPEIEQPKIKYSKTKRSQIQQSATDDLSVQSDIPVHFESYLDRKGCLLGTKLVIQITGKRKVLNIIAETVYDHYGKPIFTFKPNPEKIISSDEITKTTDYLPQSDE